MNVIEIMTKAVHTIHPDQSLKECADTLKKHRVNGLIVVEGEHVVGVVTKADIFKSASMISTLVAAFREAIIPRLATTAAFSFDPSASANKMDFTLLFFIITYNVLDRL